MEQKKFFIPAMEQTELVKWYQRISPIVASEGKHYYLRQLSDKELSKVAYNWLNKKSDFGEEVDYEKLKPLLDVKMLHTYGWYGYFKPSVAEVIRQIPKDLLSQTVAFEIIRTPSTAEDLSKYREETSAGFHVSIVRLYTRNN
jgi:hypothetical protein